MGLKGGRGGGGGNVGVGAEYEGVQGIWVSYISSQTLGRKGNVLTGRGSRFGGWPPPPSRSSGAPPTLQTLRPTRL